MLWNFGICDHQYIQTIIPLSESLTVLVGVTDCCLFSYCVCWRSADFERSDVLQLCLIMSTKAEKAEALCSQGCSLSKHEKDQHQAGFICLAIVPPDACEAYCPFRGARLWKGL